MKSLQALSTTQGVIAAIAVDQRKSLRRLLASAAGLPEAAIPDSQLAEFKEAVTGALTPRASAVLLDPEYGVEAMRQRASGTGLLVTYESDGFDNPRPHRMLALLPEYSVIRLRDLGAEGVKILLSWAPDDDPRANDEKRVLIERIGAECANAGLPFLLEPVVYDPLGSDPRSPEFAARKPALVRDTVEEFSRPVYQVDLLKIEFPAAPAHVGSAYTRAQALDAFRELDRAARCPYIYLSAGVAIDDFVASLELAAEAGAGHSGVLCGRAVWQEGIPVYMREGREALDRWLASEGVRNVVRMLDCLKGARPWQQLQRA
jgi:tagatose 1,6-diphosphate aldolase